MTTPNQERSVGFLHALLAYGMWGLFPLYWKLYHSISPIETVSHRLLWSLVVLAILVVALKQTAELRSIFRSPKRLALLATTALLLSTNWGLFIYGVVTDRVVEGSLGYFLNPLVNILLAMVFLRERLTPVQTVALVLATCGVLHFGWHLGHPPWIALGIAVTFGLYGLLRKVISVNPLPGLFVETLLLAPVGLAIIGFMASQGQAAIVKTPSLVWLFITAGIVTTAPLYWFNSAAKRLPLSTMGFIQFLTPTMQLGIGVLVFHEAFTPREGVSFLLIWLAIGLYLATVFRMRKADLPTPTSD